MTTGGLKPATFWCHLAIKAKNLTISCVLLFVRSLDQLNPLCTRRGLRFLALTATYMSLPAWSIPILKSTVSQQTAPFIVLFLIPALLIWLLAHFRCIFSHNFTWVSRVGDSHCLASGDTSSSSSHRKSKRKNSQSGGSRTPWNHAEQIALDTVRENDASGMSSMLLIIPLKWGNQNRQIIIIGVRVGQCTILSWSR